MNATTLIALLEVYVREQGDLPVTVRIDTPQETVHYDIAIVDKKGSQFLLRTDSDSRRAYS